MDKQVIEKSKERLELINFEINGLESKARVLEEKLKDADLSFDVVPYVIIQIGNIINAEDMLDIWKDLKVNVTRIDRGTPKEIPLFAKNIDEAEEKVDKSVLEKIKKLLRSIS